MRTYTITENDIYGSSPAPAGYQVVDFRPPVALEIIQMPGGGLGAKVSGLDDRPALPRRILRKVPLLKYIFTLVAERCNVEQGEWYTEKMVYNDTGSKIIGKNPVMIFTREVVS